MDDAKSTETDMTPHGAADGDSGMGDSDFGSFGSVAQPIRAVPVDSVDRPADMPAPENATLEQAVNGPLTSGMIPDVPTSDDLESLLEPGIVEYLGSLPPIPEIGPDPLDGPVIPEGGLASLMPTDEFSDELSAFALIDWPDGPDLDQILPPPPPEPPDQTTTNTATSPAAVEPVSNVLDNILDLDLPTDPEDPNGGMFGV